MKFDVTIGIPVYKSERYVRRALESALSQSYSSIEYLIVDDGGDDGSMEVVRDLQKTHRRGKDIRVIRHQENEGVSASRNQIIDEAQGDYLYFMDADDLIAENTITILIDNIRHYDAEIAFGSYERIDISGKRDVYRYPSIQFLGKDQLADFAYRKYAGIQASACNYLVKISLLRDNKLRFIDTNYWEDLVFTFDLVTYISRGVLLPDITYTYLCRENSLSHFQGRDKISKSEILRNVYAIDHLKNTSHLLHNKEYFSNRCFNIVMTDFYIACNVIKRRKDIFPSFSNREIKTFLYHPASFQEILFFQQSRMKNILLFLLGETPSSLCVFFIWVIGKIKKII